MKLLYIVDLIGYYGPNILFWLSLFLLYPTRTYLIIYIIGFILNIAINFVLKTIVKQPRPKEDLDIFNPTKKHSKRGSLHIYGMPSGHSQMVLFSTTYIYLIFKNIPLTLFYLLVAINTVFQRVRYKNHTVMQVIAGSILGIVVAGLVYKYATKKLVGKLNMKPDDNAKEITDGYSD